MELPWTYVFVGTDYRGNTRVLAASATGHGTSAANATVVATARSRGFFLGKLRRTNPGNPRKSAETAVAISMAIRGHCHGNAAITTEVRGRSRQLPPQFPWTLNRSNFHGHPRPSASIDTAILRYAATSTEVRESPRLLARAAVLSLANSVVLIMPTAIRASGSESCRGSCRGCFRGPIRGCPRTFPQTSPWVFP